MSNFFDHLKKNKRKYVFLSGLVGSGYAVYKLTKFIQNFAKTYHSHKSLNFKIQKAQYFQSMLINSFDTFENILNNLEKDIESIVDMDNVGVKLGLSCGNSIGLVENNKEHHLSLSPEEKLELWKKLKVLSFTKSVLFVYCWTYLCISIHIQMAILAGNMFQSKITLNQNTNIFSKYFQSIFSVFHSHNAATSNRNQSSIDENHQMEFINFILKQIKLQIAQWTELIHKHSTEIVGSISLKRTMTMEEISRLFIQISDNVNHEILELFCRGIQSKINTNLMEMDVYRLFAMIFENNGVEHVSPLILVLIKSINLNLQRQIGAVCTDQNNHVALAKTVPFVWASFTSRDNKSSLVDSVRRFVRNPEFRFVLFNSYDNNIDK